jgi:hypothetical protein
MMYYDPLAHIRSLPPEAEPAPEGSPLVGREAA